MMMRVSFLFATAASVVAKHAQAASSPPMSASGTCGVLSTGNRCTNGGATLRANTRAQCRELCKQEAIKTDSREMTMGTAANANRGQGCCMFREQVCTFVAGGASILAPALRMSTAVTCDVTYTEEDGAYDRSYNYDAPPPEGCDAFSPQRTCSVQHNSRDETTAADAAECLSACASRAKEGCCQYVGPTKVCSFQASDGIEVTPNHHSFAALCAPTVREVEEPVAKAAVAKEPMHVLSPPPPNPRPPPPARLYVQGHAPPPPRQGKGAVAVVGTIVGIVVVVTMGAGLARLRHDSTIGSMLIGGGGLQDISLVRQVGGTGRSDELRHVDGEGGGLILSEMSADEVAHGVSKVV